MSRAAILIVDDDAMHRLLLRKSLQAREQLQIYEAEDAAQAFELFATHTIDLLLLDVGLPDRDGFDVCHTIRASKKGANLPIVMITAADDTASIEQAFSVGATDFIAKPLNWLLIGYRLRYLLRASNSLETLRKTEQRLEHAQQIARLGYWELDLAQDRLMVSKQLAEMLSLPGQRLDNGLEQLVNSIHPNDRIGFKLVLHQTSLDSCSFNQDVRISSAAPSYMHIQGQRQQRWGADGALIVGTMQDISELKASQQRLTYMAHYDALTELPNRTLFQTMFERGIQRAQRMQRKVAVLFIDLDRFKNINDSLGHDVGDELLKEVAKRQKQALRSYDVIARLGGDEFAVMLDAIDDEHDARQLSQRILDAFKPPFKLGKHTLYLSASIGISLYPDNGASSEALLKHADTAMYQAKQSEQHQLIFYTNSQTDATMQRWQLENDLRQALDREEFSLLYQPKIDPNNHRMLGVEALIRWNRAGSQPTSPAEFIPVAEETGLIIPIGNWVIDEAIQQLKRWQQTACRELTVAVNVSGRQLYSKTLAGFIDSKLKQAGVAADKLELEITEEYLVPSNERDDCQKTLQRLHNLGIRMAIDDFGTGYSCLSQLKSLPLSVLKIDSSFTQKITDSPQDEAVVKSIISLAGNFKLEVVAEGVETQQQLAHIRDCGCHLVQGYFYSPPVSAAAILTLLEQQTTAPACKQVD